MTDASRLQLASVLAKKTNTANVRPKSLAREIAAYLLATSQTGELNSLARDMINDRAASGIIEVTAVSARELAPANTAEIRAEVKKLYPAAKQIIINERIDLTQVGGVRLEFPDKQLDLSLRGKLNRFKQLTTRGN